MNTRKPYPPHQEVVDPKLFVGLANAAIMMIFLVLAATGFLLMFLTLISWLFGPLGLDFWLIHL